MPELPEQLLNSLEALHHFNREAFCAAHERGERETSIRLNPFKRTEPTYDLVDMVPWCTDGFYLRERPVFTLDPLFHAGCYYVQEPGSMFLGYALKHFLGDLSGKAVLDLCAAPGGKSTHLNSLIGPEGLLVSNEITRGRVPALVHNLGKWGTLNSVVTNSDPAAFAALGGLFDVMVADAPCSGSGLFRKQPEAIAEWSEANVMMCGRRQRQILGDALPALKEGGLLFYSTCSYSVEENEDIVNWLVGSHGMKYLPIQADPAWNLADTGAGIRFYPDQARSEGFFCAVLLKTTDSPNSPRSRRHVSPASKAQQTIASPLFSHEQGRFGCIKNNLHFLTERVTEFIDLAADKLYLRKAGHYVGEIKGSDLVPSQEAAWSVHLSPGIPHLELDLENALRYLRKQPLAPPAGERGLHLVTFRNHGLGWAKMLPGRINNYLPAELRILM